MTINRVIQCNGRAGFKGILVVEIINGNEGGAILKDYGRANLRGLVNWCFRRIYNNRIVPVQIIHHRLIDTKTPPGRRLMVLSAS